MSDYPCRDCGHEGRGPWAHSADCWRQVYKVPLEVCRVCRNIWLRKDQKVCEYCMEREQKAQRKLDPLEDFWYGQESTKKAPRGKGKG